MSGRGSARGPVADRMRQLHPVVVLALALALGALVVIAIAVNWGFLDPDRVALALACVGCGSLALVSVRYPVALVYAVLLFEALLSWRDNAQIQLLGRNRLLFYAVMVGTFTLAVLYTVVWRRRRLQWRGVDAALGLYVLGVAVTALTALDMGAARSATAYIIASVAVVYTTRLVVSSQRHIDAIMTFLLGIMVVESFLGVAQFFSGAGVLHMFSGVGNTQFIRATGTLGNGLGWFLDAGFIFAFCLWYFGRDGSYGRRLLLVVCVIEGGLLVANTRGAWVDSSMTVSFAVVLGLTGIFAVRKSRWVGLVVLAMLAIGLIQVSDSLRTRVPSIVTDVAAEVAVRTEDPVGSEVSEESGAPEPSRSSVGFRLHVWETAFTVFRSRPWVGVGPDNFRHVFPEYATPEAAEFLRLELGRTYSAHHVGLEILAESGLVGIATFGLFLLLYLREAWRLRLTLGTGRPGLAAGYLVFAVVSSIAMLYGGYAYGGYTEVGRLYFVVVGLTLAQGDLLRQAP